jgi:hypothetical protein
MLIDARSILFLSSGGATSGHAQMPLLRSGDALTCEWINS